MNKKIAIVKPDEVETAWDMVSRFLNPAIKEDLYHSEDSLKDLLLKDQALMFVAFLNGKAKGAAIVQIEEGKDNLVNILCLGGQDFKEWKQELNDALTKYAIGMNCKSIVALGRPGWKKLWPDFKAGKTLFCKEVIA